MTFRIQTALAGLMLAIASTPNVLSYPGSAGTSSYAPSIQGSSLVTVIGHKAQSKAALIDERGRMLLQANNIRVDDFGLFDQSTSRIQWSYDQGYYPSSIHEFDIPNFKVKIKFFCYPKPITSIGEYNGDFVLVYARVQLTYSGSLANATASVNIAPPSQLTPINAAAIQAGGSPITYSVASNTPIVLDYATATERISGNGSDTLSPSEIQGIAGSLDSAEAEFKAFWDTELERLVSPVIPPSVPDAIHLTNAQKVAFIHMQVIRDGNNIHIGKNGYDTVYDHDAHGILAIAIEMGALTPDEAEALLRNLPAQQVTHDYIDALGKIVWVHAKFCQKFAPSNALLQDLVFSQLHPGYGGSKTVSGWIHHLVDTKLQADGLAVPANTLDSGNRATVDNCAVLLGLKSYAYLCSKLGNTTESSWALNKYNQVNTALQDKLLALVASKPENQRYISASITTLTENVSNFTLGGTSDPFTDANAYSHFFFGRMYELFLLGGSYDRLAPYIDNTLDVGLSRKSGDTRFVVNGQWTGNFGVYFANHHSNGYNSAYTEGFLLGNGKYRDAFFKSFSFMMGLQTGPYGWFEGVRGPEDYGVNIQGVTTGAKVGTGSSPHVWSGMSQARMLTTSLVSETYDGSVVIGRGIPTSWFEKGTVGVNHYKLSDTSRFAYTIKPTGNTGEYEFAYTGQPAGAMVLNLIPFLTQAPRLVQFGDGTPADRAKVRLADFDDDGTTEITIDPEYSGRPVVFSIAPTPALLLHEPFSNSSTGNLPGQPTPISGFATATTWSGLNSSFASNVADAATVQASGLVWGDLASTPKHARVKGDASNTRAMMDVSAAGVFASAGLRDASSNTVGGGSVAGKVYVSFLFRAMATDRNNEFGGLQLARANSDTTGVLIGNAWDAWAYGLRVGSTGLSFDLKDKAGTGNYKDMDNETHLMVARIEFKANASDVITVWMDPELGLPETSQNLSGVYTATATGDFSFDRLFLRGGNATRQFEYDEIRMGTSWNDVTPLSDTALASDTLKASLRADGSLSRILAKRDGAWEEIPFRDDGLRGPTWQVTTGSTSQTVTMVRDGVSPSFTGSSGGRIFKLSYQLDAEGLRLTARAENPTSSAWTPDRASICLGINSYMDAYPAWNDRYFPTLLRCEKTHFWGYFMSPLGKILGCTVADPVASWHHDYESGQHRIRTSFLDLFQSGRLPERHPQGSSTLPAGQAREWRLSLFDLPSLESAPAALASASAAPLIQANRYQGEPGETVTFTVHGQVTSLAANGTPLSLAGVGADRSAATWTFPATFGEHKVIATDADGQISECRLVTRRPLSWYLTQARTEAIRKPQKASSHTESWYGLFSGYLARRHFPDASSDAAIEAKFNEIFPLMYNSTTSVPTSDQNRIQNHSSMAGVLVDRYQATGDVTSLVRAAAICDFLLTKQGSDGGYYSGSTHYTSVIYIAKSIMEVMREEKRLADAGDATWQARYDRHYQSVKRAMDDLVNRGANVQTEGQQTYEDGMISCSYTQLAEFALLQTVPAERERYANAAIALAQGHQCLSQKLIPDGLMNGGSLRFWEAQYDVLTRAANMMNSPHGWSAWRLYGLCSLYELTGDPAYLRDAMSGLGSCLQTIDPVSGELRWSFIVDPSVAAGVFTEFSSSPGKGRCVPTTVGEQYLPMISGWYRAPANTKVTGYWGGKSNGTGLSAGETWPPNWITSGVQGGDGGCCDNDVHEIFKCLEEIALTSTYLVLGAEGSVETWNGSAEMVGNTLVLTPAEAVVNRVHVNRRGGAAHRLAVRFGDQLIDPPSEASAWVEKPSGESPYHLWRKERFGSDYALTPAAMDDADPDGDGVDNRLEFLLEGRDPTQFDEEPKLVRLGGPDEGWFEFSIDRNPEALPEQVRIRVSSDLVHWDEVTPSVNAELVVIEDSASRHAIKIHSTSGLFLTVAK